MQNYNQPPGYQRPGSTASFAGPAGPPPPYGAAQGYQSAAPQAQSQWAPPTQSQPPNQQWNQQPQQQAHGGYNPGTYGAMPGAYTQGQQVPANQPSNQYPPQSEIPPPPPPKPAGFAAAVHQQQQQQQQQQQSSQNWNQQPAYGVQQSQQNTGFAPQGQQGGYSQQGGFQNQGAPQQPYNNAAPPPPSQTPGGSYFPPTQTPQGGRPGSIYGADQVQAGTYSSPSSAVAQHPPSTVLSPNEQQPAYIPPSLTGQGVQSYMPANTNPLPGVYVPPPPDIPAWQQAQHAPLQGANKKFRYTKPTVDPSFYAQGYQGLPQPSQPQGQFGQQGQAQQQTQYGQHPHQNQQQFGQPQNQFPPQGQVQQQGQFGQPQQQQQFGQPGQQPGQFQQQPQVPPYNQTPQGQQSQQPQQYQQQQNQWQPTPPADQVYGQQQQAPYGAPQAPQQQGWQPGHQAQSSIVGQQYFQGQDQGIQAPKPINGHTGSTPPGFVNAPSPQSHPVSPVQNRQSMSFASGQSQANLGRTSSVSSIALGAIHSQRAGTRTDSPKPPVAKVPTPPPPRDDASKFSAIGFGGPSDWEHFGAGAEEVDDEELFGAKKEEKKKDEPAQLDSVELPAPEPSPATTQGEWPTPPSQPAPLNVGIQRRDTYQPTPPTTGTSTPTQRPSSQPPQQSFVMGDAVVAPAHTQSPQPSQNSQPPPAQQSFVMDDGGWAPPKQSTPAQQQPQHQPPPSQQSFVMDDGGWAAQSAPAQARETSAQKPEPPPVATNFIVDDGRWGATQQTPTQPQRSEAWQQQNNEAHAAELKAKDEAYERLKADLVHEMADLHEEIEKLKADAESARSHAAGEKNVLEEQIAAMRIVADQAQVNADALAKEKDSTIERLKEDAEGRDDVIRERDATIADLRRQLDAEKAKEPPKPMPADLIPDIDPWYASSLERYIVMLRSEASEPQVEDKIKAFKGFLKAESAIRGLEYYDAPPAPPAPPGQEPVQQVEQSGPPQEDSNASARKQDLNIQAPQESPPQDEFQYSPGGRPIMPRKATLKSNESIPTQQSFNQGSFSTDPSAQSTTILTPTSSTDGDFNKTPIQSPPEEQTQPQYKAYVPPGVTPTESAQALHRQSLSFASVPPVAPLQTAGSSKKHDEIFFGGGAQESKDTSKPNSRPTTSGSTISDVPVPAPLSFTPQPSVAMAEPKKDPLEVLTNLLPAQIASAQSNTHVEEIRKKAQDIPSDFAYIQELTVTWEKSAALNRIKNDVARRQRQEESEAHTDELFNAHEISYADIGALEDEFKEKERELKAQEDRDEYKTYVESVFDKVYDGLQADIKALMDLYIETENLLHTSVSGVKSLGSDDALSTQSTLELLKELHDKIELRHEKVVAAVAERDKRYKKTEIQPLYAAGNIAKMKTVEKHFENAERQAVLRAKSEKAERIGELVRVSEEFVVQNVGVEQGEIDKILDAIRALDKGDEEILGKAHTTLNQLKASSKALLSLFNAFEIELNTCVLEAEMAQARVENAGPDRIKELEKEMQEGEKKLKDEFERRVGVLEQDGKEIGDLVKEKGGKVEVSEEEERKRRLQAALEEAKRRNGDL